MRAIGKKQEYAANDSVYSLNGLGNYIYSIMNADEKKEFHTIIQ